MIDLLFYPLLSGLFLSISFALIGVVVVLKRMSFIGAGLSHAAFAGVSLSLFFSLPYYIGTFAYNLLSSLIISRFKEIKSEDSIIGVIFSFSMALAIGLLYIGGVTTSITQILFGDILTVTSTDAILSFLSLIAVALTFYKYGKHILYFAFDEEYLASKGYDTDKIYLFLLIIISLLITTAIKIIGILLVSAFLVIPPLSSVIISNNTKQLILYSIAFSSLSVIIGILLSLFIDVPSSALIVFASSLIFLLSYAKKGGKR